MRTKHIYTGVLLVSIACLTTACGQNQTPATTGQAAVKKFSKTTTIKGTVSTGRALIKTGTLEVTDENGQKLQQVTVEGGRFQVDIPSGTSLPLVLSFNSEGHPEKLQTVVLYEDVVTYFIDPSTTGIAKAAKAMGGYTRANLVRAAEDTTHSPDANKTTAGWRGDPTTQYGGWH